MKSLKHHIITGILFVLIAGSLAHFLYDWSNKNVIVGLFAPINESIWEHMKLLFFPMLLYALATILKFRQTYPCVTSAFCFGILFGTCLIPLIYYSYTAVLGKHVFVCDLIVFVVSIVLSFWISYRLTLSCRLQAYTLFLCICVFAFFVCFLVFTVYPPNIAIFIDPTN